MGVRSAEGFIVDVLSNGRLDQVTAGEEDGTGVPHNQGFIAHNGQVRAARHTGPHDRSDLWNAHGTHARIVPKNSSEVFFVGENFVLHRQEDARAVHQVNDGNAVFHGDFLCTQVFLSGDGEPSSCLYRGIVGDGDDQPAFDVAQLHNDAPSWAAPFFLIHALAR